MILRLYYYQIIEIIDGILKQQAKCIGTHEILIQISDMITIILVYCTTNQLHLF